jgi:hypothetical protein
MALVDVEELGAAGLRSRKLAEQQGRRLTSPLELGAFAQDRRDCGESKRRDVAVVFGTVGLER